MSAQQDFNGRVTRFWSSFWWSKAYTTILVLGGDVLPTKNEFARALGAVKEPKGRQLDFLRAHAKAPQRRLSARQLANSARYKGPHGINLQYGLLAGRIAEALGGSYRSDVQLTLLVKLIRPRQGEEWQLEMRKEFAEALKQAGWLDMKIAKTIVRAGTAR